MATTRAWPYSVRTGYPRTPTQGNTTTLKRRQGAHTRARYEVDYVDYLFHVCSPHGAVPCCVCVAGLRVRCKLERMYRTVEKSGTKQSETKLNLSSLTANAHPPATRHTKMWMRKNTHTHTLHTRNIHGTHGSARARLLAYLTVRYSLVILR